jgi:hypothetical protein
MTRFSQIRSGGWWRSGALILWLAACSGCGDSAPAVTSSTEEATVHGVVTIDGKPAAGGKITFKSANIARKSAPDVSADIGKDGSYTLKTLVGENQIRVQPSDAQKNSRYKVDVFEVQSGDNTHDVTLAKL